MLPKECPIKITFLFVILTRLSIDLVKVFFTSSSKFLTKTNYSINKIIFIELTEVNRNTEIIRYRLK